MLVIALVLLFTGLAIWVLLFLVLRSKLRVRFRYELGGGLPRYAIESWSTSEAISKFSIEYQDIKLLDRVFVTSSTRTLEELELMTKESGDILAKRLSKLEQLGLITRTTSGTYEITEYGRKVLETYKERLRSRRREEEVLEGI